MDNETNQMNTLNELLEAEMRQNKTEAWNKLDNATKLTKLHLYADTYPDENALLKEFFNECIEKGKLKKVKDVVYDKEEGTISSIPGLYFNKNHKKFTIKNLEKRVSTMKSLTPKRINSNKNKSVSNKKITESEQNEA